MLENFNFDFFLWPWLRESHKNLQERRVLCRLRDPPASANENRAEGQDALPRINGQRFVLFSTKDGLLPINGQSPVHFEDKSTKTENNQSIMVTSLYEEKCEWMND